MAGKNILKVCLLHGQRCHFASYKYILRKSSFQVKICKANFPCNQQLITSAWSLAKIGKCEKADFCLMASEACKLARNKGVALPEMRWVNCLYGKEAGILV